MILFLLACGNKESDSATPIFQSTLSGYVTNLIGGGGIEDVEVCLTECTTTNSDGSSQPSALLGRQVLEEGGDIARLPVP